MPGLTPREHAIFQGADAAAALVGGGRVIAASAQERFDGVKHSSVFPADAATFCLEYAGLSAADLDVVAHSFSFGPEREFYTGLPGFYADMYDEVLAPEVNQRAAEEALGVDLAGRFTPVPHHLAHAASAYVPSGFTESLVLVADGLGERHSTTVLAARPDGYETLSTAPAHSSLGLLYGLFTLYLGFWFGDGEYKVMGLAPYGDPSKYAPTIMRNWVALESEGRFSLSVLLANVTDLEKETYRGALTVLEQELGPARGDDEPLEQRHMDIAAGLQSVVQTVQMHLLRHFRAQTGLSRLCLAGGVGLNCVANGALLRSGLFDDIYVQPAAGDDGAALGAALYVAQTMSSATTAPARPLLGPEYDGAECRAAAQAAGGVTLREFESDAALVGEVSDLIAAGAVVGWFSGRMEYGPRALGSRSILADPRRTDMRDRINSLVKKRESFRPFAPAISAAHAADWFEIEPEDVHRFADMLFVAYVRPERAELLPATTHVDGSARVQTVDEADNPRFWSLIEAFGQRTGVPVLLNTSFNVRGQPIVRTPAEAVTTFLDAGLDALVLGDLLLIRDAADSSQEGSR
ncbi:carbamoyltransferase C-terminal domain-containing protein [Lentzea sp. BCCO 10_0061]|uniref:Carbamoyltransferase C-terminal domain-containing protein n=1 Tax=Lentzea sokolovensis TaxID=3095429 RepID=A0ABU4V6K1_9PSEU|nr:carbamoyltransferase C-terminal domain-containing protein [Lentzea sp. BCCO 10_0061]MDX8147105.1 carbamoyltransferase C-terminal domain-containing protein [Lentzea sp. BCCO 10_0061]